MNIENICLFSGGQMLVRDDFSLPSHESVLSLLPSEPNLMRVSANSGLVAMAYALSGECPDAPVGMSWQDFRPLFDVMDADLFALAVKAKEAVFWEAHSRFCPSCGTPTRFLTDLSRKCPQCGYELYPPLAPAIIVRVRRGADEILMVRAHNFRGDHYGLVAGFLEAGESLEECVERELMEETGLRVQNVRYFGSQAWPFPCGEMIAFTADYASGDIRIQKEELADAAFFHRDALPKLPHKMSIARRLVDDFINEKHA